MPQTRPYWCTITTTRMYIRHAHPFSSHIEQGYIEFTTGLRTGSKQYGLENGGIGRDTSANITQRNTDTAKLPRTTRD